MALSSPSMSVNVSSTSQAQWYYLYYALAAFDALTVLLSLYLSVQIMSIYIHSVEVNQQWAQRLAAYSELGQLAQAVNAPGNDVFDSHDVSAESVAMQTALQTFNTRLAELRKELVQHSAESQRTALLPYFDTLDAAIHEMVGEAQLIFSYFSQNRAQEAGQRMATMDRKYAVVNDVLARLRAQVAEIQNVNFAEQVATAIYLQKFEYLVVIGILLMVGAAAFYGRQISRRVKRDVREREQMMLTLAETSHTLEQKNMELSRARDAALEDAWVKTGLTTINDCMRGVQDLDNLSQQTLRAVASYVNAHVGTLYLEKNESLFQLAGGYAYTPPQHRSHEFRIGEGLVGQAALEKKPLVLSRVPADYLTITSGLGEATPLSLSIIPLIYQDHVEGVFELGTFQQFGQEQMMFLTQAAESMAAAFASLRARLQVEEYLGMTQRQAAELQAQQEELQTANEQLAEQTHTLQTSEAHLKAQQEELQQINEELEEKTELLVRRNTEVEQNHREVEQARQALEEKAEQLALTSKYKSEFLANMSHELRTPLNSLLILAQQLVDNPEHNLTEKQIQYARTIHGAGTDLLTLISEILDLSKIESGTVRVEISEIPLSNVCRSLEQTFTPLAESKGLNFTIDTDPTAPRMLTTDGDRLQQILKNLLSNACKFTSRGQVAMRIHTAPSGWSSDHPVLNRAEHVLAFAVRDTGIGIPEDKQRVIFEAFQQADGTTSRKYGGTGLGLAISRELAALLGGEISLSSEPGAGSTFTLYLPLTYSASVTSTQGSRMAPLHSDEPGKAKVIPLLASPMENGNSVRSAPLVEQEASVSDLVADDRHDIHPGDRVLLIIEDDLTFSQILLDRAHEMGFKGIIALQGRTALTLAQQFKPVAITLDLGLPDMNGWVLLDRLKIDPVTRHIPVHIISATDERERGLQHGAFAYLLKPASREALEHAFAEIGRFLERRVRQLLVVEDDPVQRQSIIELIGDGDVITTAVASGAAALAILDTRPFDCMVLDLRLPDIDGFQLLEEMQKRPGLHTLPVIIYTGKDVTREEETRLKRMAQTIIVKDVRSPDRLLDETALFLHRVAANLPEPKQRMLERLRQTDTVLSGKTLLVVDDDIRNLFALTALLERYQIHVITAESGREALVALEKTPNVNAVLMDIMMPEMDGYETMRAIRQNLAFQSLPVIALTAKAMRGDREKCIEAGASDYITKPINNEQLLSLLRVWLYR